MGGVIGGDGPTMMFDNDGNLIGFATPVAIGFEGAIIKKVSEDGTILLEPEEGAKSMLEYNYNKEATLQIAPGKERK